MNNKSRILIYVLMASLCFSSFQTFAFSSNIIKAETVQNSVQQTEDSTEEKDSTSPFVLFVKIVLKLVVIPVTLLLFFIWVMLCAAGFILIFSFDLVTFFQLGLIGGYWGCISKATSAFFDFLMLMINF